MQFFLLTVILIYGKILFAQDIDTDHQQFMENVMETLSEREGEDDDITSLFEDIDNCRQNPLNINTISYEQLKALSLLNEYQIAVILDYRKTKGALMSLSELLYLPGFRNLDIERMQPFVICAEPRKERLALRRLFDDPKQQLTIRYQRVLEQQVGYRTIPDSVLLENLDKSRYLGTPDKLFFRYKISCHDIIKAGLVMEKDPGEEFFNGSNKNGFDFYSAFAAYSNCHSFIKDALIGDYHVQLGQGLLAWSSFSFGKTPYVDGMFKSTAIFHGNSSADENKSLRGAAFKLGWERFSLSLFASRKKVDASLADSILGEELFTGLVETGYHATPQDLLKEDILLRSIYGSSLRLNLKHIKVGLNGLFMQYNKDCIGNDGLYQSYSYKGKTLTGASLDYRVLFGKAQFYGESAISYGHLASLNGLMIFLKPEISLGILHRHYDKEYYSYYSGAFGENSSIRNEDGFFIGSQIQFSKIWCRVYVDLFSFPWLKYQANTPSTGYEVFLECGRKISWAEIYFRYDHREKPENAFEEDHRWIVKDMMKEKFRINSKVSAGSYISLQNRIELIRARGYNDTNHFGYYLSQDVLIQKMKVPLEFTLRLAWFHSEQYETRIYAYERDVYSAGTSTMLYGKGWRYMFLIRWKASDKISCWLKLAQSLYPEDENIGTGLSTIDSNHRTEIKLQLVFRL